MQQRNKINQHAVLNHMMHEHEACEHEKHDAWPRGHNSAISSQPTRSTTHVKQVRNI